VGFNPTDAAVTTFYLWCAILGGTVLVFQLVAGFIGLEHGADHDGHFGDGASEGLSLLSVRSIAAGVAFFGLTALSVRSFGPVASLLAGIVGGGVAMVGVASLIKMFGRLERDGTLSLASAVGTTGSVYLSIPARREGVGKVHLIVQNRLVELRAITDEDDLATGTPILVVDVEGTDTVVVVRNPILLNEVSNAGA
jgi:hypothetical protein